MEEREGVKRLLEDKDRIAQAKDDMIASLKESSDVAKALNDVVRKTSPFQKWGGFACFFSF
jgi:hypothetical protein